MAVTELSKAQLEIQRCAVENIRAILDSLLENPSLQKLLLKGYCLPKTIEKSRHFSFCLVHGCLEVMMSSPSSSIAISIGLSNSGCDCQDMYYADRDVCSFNFNIAYVFPNNLEEVRVIRSVLDVSSLLRANKHRLDVWVWS